MSAEHLLVTGCYRSGTTLLEKLLHQVDGWSVASQPAPSLYFQAKQRFLDGRGLDRRYPLGHLFGESDYRPADLAEALAGQQWDDTHLDRLFADLAAYQDGLWTPQTLTLRDEVGPGSFLEVQERIHLLLARRFGFDAPEVVGGKEILCEEFAPFLLDHGHRVVVIIRDPRDMIASLDFRERDNLTGDHRPMLHSLRTWRKSVAFAVALRDHPGFVAVRMEDLVADTDAVVSSIVQRDVAVGEGPITGQNGTAWRGNSSFADVGGVDPGVVGRHHDLLPPDVVSYVEALTRPEMVLMGYEPSSDAVPTHDLLARFDEPFPVHEKFSHDYAKDPARTRDEVRRWELVTGVASAGEVEARRLFIFPELLQQLSDPIGAA